MQPTLEPGPLATWRMRTREIDPNFVSELIADVLSDTAAQLPVLERASAERDAAACKFVAHRMKSSFISIGAVRLASLFEEMELLAKGGALTFLHSQFAAIRAEYARVEPVLQRERYS